MLTKVLPNVPIRIQAQEFTHDFHRQHFTVGQLRGKTPLAQALIPDHQTPVGFYPAKPRDDKVFKRHGDVPANVEVVGSSQRISRRHAASAYLHRSSKKSNIA
nr:hypothetical protein [Candidatus Contendobacter odensis]